MTGKLLSAYFNLHRRYYRSVNLERDFDRQDAVQGYVPTERSTDALRRILSALNNLKAHRAWTMTGVYGTGKSAFAHYLACLCAPENSQVRQVALEIAHRSFGVNSPEVAAMEENLPNQGLLRAVATSQREPLSWTIVRALANGAGQFWQGKRKPEAVRELTDWAIEIEDGSAQITNQQVLTVLREVVKVAKVNVLLIIDELGKNLEYAARHQGIEDLYLLQQIAELRLKEDHQVYFLGLLHQSFAGYSERLAAVEQSEWSKIQGRFEDIPFAESPSQMTRLIGQAIDRTQADPVLYLIHDRAQDWFNILQSVLTENEISEKVLADAYPLHPIAALVLPMLCTRYAQNDRSLFTFLTSDETYAFPQFLKSEMIQGDDIPTLKLHQIYDYFVESVTGLASRINLQRWVEIQGLIQDARDRNPDVLKVLKTIGILNLVTSTGVLRATPQFVTLALCNRADDKTEQKHWQEIIKKLQQNGLITYRSQLDELRIWQGSDFNVEAAIYSFIERERTPLAELLSAIRPLKPLVAERHYTTTGTLRYFEQRYVDSLTKLAELRCSIASYDGLIVYWMDAQLPDQIPVQTVDGKPLIVVSTTGLDVLKSRAQQFQALNTIQKKAAELLTDGVAKREVRQRLVEAERLLDETLIQAFNWLEGQNTCWIEGQQEEIGYARVFQSKLSDVCDRTYQQGLILDNEFINRRELTSQGAKARRELIEAMLEHGNQERLALEGYGPEVAIYYSVLEATMIHRQEDGEWGFYPPRQDSGVTSVWQAIEAFCTEAKDKQRSLNLLYQRLEQSPYGVKQGAIPIMLAALLLYHIDDIGVYRDGTFIPVLGQEHFELLLKDPSRFSVKYFEIVGLRSQVFRELEAVLKSPKSQMPTGVRNVTVLAVAKPLFQFVRKLPTYTLKTKRLSSEAHNVLRTLQQAQEPDELLFTSLPQACGLPPIGIGEVDDNEVDAALCEYGTTAKILRQKLVQALLEIQTAYDRLLSESKSRLHDAFGVRSDEINLRKDLGVRASYLLGQCVERTLRSFTLAAVDETKTDAEWLEALVMIVADKPAESWTDEDVTGFEIKLSDLARRFKNLEALQTEVAAKGSQGFEARKITVTRPDGEETNRMVWFENGQKDRIDGLLEEILGTLSKYETQLQQAVVAKLTERVLGSVPQDNIAQIRDKRQDQKYEQEKSQTHSRSIGWQG